MKHRNTHVRSSFFSQTETKSLNQKITATHFPFLFFKILFFELTTNSHIKKKPLQINFIISYLFKNKDESKPKCPVSNLKPKSQNQKTDVTQLHHFHIFKICTTLKTKYTSTCLLFSFQTSDQFSFSVILFLLLKKTHF